LKFRKLNALAAFSKEKWETAVEEFIQLDIAPAKVVSLYPADTVSGPLHMPQENWVQVFGGPEDGRLTPLQKLKGIAHIGGIKKDSASIKGKDSASIRGKDSASVKGRDGDAGSVMGDEATLHESSKDSVVEYEGE
jgi:hypothetical protein